MEGSFQEELGEVIVLYFYDGNELIDVSARNVEIPQDTRLVYQALAGQSSFGTVETAESGRIRLYGVPFSPDSPVTFRGRPGRFPDRSRGLPDRLDIQSAALVVGRSTEDRDAALQRLRYTLLLAVPLTLIFAGGGGVFLARRALKPVEQIAQTAQEIEEHDLSRRIEVHTRDELGGLAATLNQMIERLERAFKRQRQFTADASHELRTPLAAIQAESTLTLQKEREKGDYKKSLELISQDAAYMSGTIDKLLALARADAGKEQLSFEQIDLSEFLSGLAPDVEILCREKGLQFQLDQMENLIVRGDRVGLRVLFSNLIDNAIRYTTGGGTVAVSLAKEGHLAIVNLRDTGVGIPPEDMPHIFERFYRVDKAHSRSEGGSGLGLAICQHIAEVHGGKIEVESRVGKGSAFSVFLPLSS